MNGMEFKRDLPKRDHRLDKVEPRLDKEEGRRKRLQEEAMHDLELERAADATQPAEPGLWLRMWLEIRPDVRAIQKHLALWILDQPEVTERFPRWIPRRLLVMLLRWRLR